MKTSIGGDRLGSGNKQTVNLKTFNRSTHDLSYIWRSTMSAGTLVPFMSKVALPGDTFEINLNCDVKTLPTVGPLFGSFKVQLDVFSCPVRLYNGKLHMNKLGIGMDMSQIKLPYLNVGANNPKNIVPDDNHQVNPSSLLAYLGIRGVGVNKNLAGTNIYRKFNAVPFLSYWDIYKNYYANKQEERGVVIHNNQGANASYSIQSATLTGDFSNLPANILEPQGQGITEENASELTIVVVLNPDGEGQPDWSDLVFKNTLSDEQWGIDDFTTVSANGLTIRLSGVPTDGENVLGYMIVDSVINSVDVDPDRQIKLREFPLENIDKMREDILSTVSDPQAFPITRNSLAPYGLILDRDSSANPNTFALTESQEGLGIKTYQSDLFNNWISTEWIDGANGINEVTKVNTEEGGFTIDTLNLANKVYNMLNRIAISGGTYDDWLDAVYTHERSKSVESPVYAGSLIKELSFQEVISNAATEGENENNPLGTLAGRGTLTDKNKGGYIKIKVDEPSYIIGIASLTPRIDYSQGNDWDVNLKTMNDFHKPSLDEIGYQDLVTDQLHWADTYVDEDGEPRFKSAGKQPAWINYMTAVNKVRGDFAKIDDSMFMTLNRRYELNDYGISDVTTYIDPQKFTYLFADTRLDAQNFWVQIGARITARRKMSAKVIPNL